MLSIILTLFALGTVLNFMSVIALNREIKLNRDENREHWKSVEFSLEIQANKIGQQQITNHALEQELLTKLGYDLNIAKEELLKKTEKEATRVILTPLKVKWEDKK